jgi:hypothetical protein
LIERVSASAVAAASEATDEARRLPGCEKWDCEKWDCEKWDEVVDDKGER